MEENEVAATAPKAPPEAKEVRMTDGRTVKFVGKRRMIKESIADGSTVTTRFDFVNGETRSFTVDLTDELAPKFLGHGIEQKVGDETAGDKDVEDMVLHVDNILDRLSKGEWGIERGASDGFAGANVVMRAIAEVKGKDINWVKEMLKKKLADNPGLTRQKLYAAFRAPGAKTAPVIARMEAEKAAKDGGIDANEALAEFDSE